LRGCYFTRVGKGANANSVRDAVETIASKAQFSGDRRKVFLRTAEADGKLYVDLTDDEWRVVEIDATGWRVLDQSPVMFTRRGSQAQFPVPESGGSMSLLWPFLNVPAKLRVLVTGWLLSALLPFGPYPILLLQGEANAAKTLIAWILRSLCDPSTVPLRAPTRDERDFLVSAVSNWCVCIDNLSGMQPWLSDALCRLSTGGGFAARTLYTNCDETAIQIERPVILNGVDVGAVRGDLLSRVVSLTLRPIPEAQRLAPDDLKSAFEKARPRILGVWFTALAQAIREKSNVKLTRKPRMIGFVRLVVAAETALGFTAGEFMAAYQKNLDDGVMDVIEASKEAQALLVFMAERQEWKGTATDLWKAVVPGASDEPTRVAPSWPQSGRGMTAVLTRVAQALRQIGIHYEHLPRAKCSRWLRVWKVPAQPSESSEPPEPRRNAGSSTDG
jgi:hypothetical protein